MVPDFDRLRKPSCDHTDLQPLKPRSGNGFSEQKSFQQFDNDLDDRALQAHHPAISHDSSDIDYLFFQLWLEQPSWSPIVKNERGWQTIVNHTGKKVPLVLGTIKSYFRRGHILGKRFGRLTNYLVIDVDINSPFHPRNGGIKLILAAMEAIGLCRYLLIRSSASGGLHIYFPLAEPVSSWGLACATHAALTAHGIQIVGGQCELFPNKKSFNAEHNGHRLPLQDGSFLLDDDFGCISNDKADFLQRWQTAATHQDEETLQLALTGKIVFAPSPVPTEVPSAAIPQVLYTPTARTNHVIPPIAWTGFGQSNDVMRELVNYGDRYVGLKNATDLAAWVKAVAPQLPGYQKFASPKSKRDIERGNWPYRWAKSHFESVWKYKVGGSDHNANVARDAKWRLFAALERVCVDINIGITQLWKQVSGISAVCFDKSIGWKTFTKHRDEVLAYVKRAGVLGLSRGSSENVNSSSSELARSQNAEPELPGKRSYTQLLTLRCVTAIYSSVFASFTTSKNGAEPGGYTTAKTIADFPNESAVTQIALGEAASSLIETANYQIESREGLAQTGFSAGQRVRIVMLGGSLDGIETQVLAQTANVLGQPVYQLDYRRQGQAISLPAECLQVVEAEGNALPGEVVIKATAAQLLQVLGKACPFVGPGLWTVRRGEVSLGDWNKLRLLTKPV